MNRVTLKGNLARDPEVKTIEVNDKSTTVANFTIAVSRFFKRSDGTKAKNTEFIACAAWDTGAESIGKLLSKGDPVLLEGSLKTESWEKDGQKFSRLKVRVSTFECLYRAPKKEGEFTEDTPEMAVAGSKNKNDANDIPF